MPRIQVLAFESVDTSYAYLASGLAEDVRAGLLSTHAVVVVGPHANSALADYVLSGSVRGNGSGVAVDCRLEQLRSGSVLWTARVSRLARDLAGLPDELSGGALHAIGIRPAPAAATARTDGVTYDLYIRGRFLMNRRTEASVARAVELLRQAVARDSTNPYGWAGLARALTRASKYHFRVHGIPAESLLSMEFAASERAVELAPRNPDVLMMRGLVAQDVDPTTRRATVSAFREALAADSLSGDAWHLLGMSLMEIGDSAGAAAALQRAASLDPGNGEVLQYLAVMWFLRRQFDSAAVWADRSIASDPTYPVPRGLAGQAALWQGRIDEAQAHFEAADRLAGQPNDGVGAFELARALAARGDSARARAYVAALAATADSTRPSVHVAPAMADAYLAIGDTAQAFWWLERYQPRRDVHFQMHLRSEPAFDGLRSNPRFQALLAPQR